MLQDDKNYYNEKNWTRNDSGLGADAKNVGIAQENIRQDVNGSTDKPYPQERNFVVDANATIPFGMSEPSMPSTTDPDVRLGQKKYARREGAPSIYKDATRNTADDNSASAKAEGSTIYEPEGENRRDD
jgi:hypothetical protein